MGVSFKQITLSQLQLVSHKGEVVEGNGILNGAAFTIHSHVHAARPDVVAAAHAHYVHRKAWSSLGRLLDPITQDACAFYDDHALYDDFGGVALSMEEGERITKVGMAPAVELQQRIAVSIKTTFASQFTEQISLRDVIKPEVISRYTAKKTGSKFLVNPDA